MKKSINISSLLFLAIISANLFYNSQCYSVDDSYEETCDSYYEDNRQELADEIDDVNDYMQMVADQLTNDGVVVVRALRTRFNTPEMEDFVKSDDSAMEAGDDNHPKETESLEKITSNETECLEDGDTSSIYRNNSVEMKQNGFEFEKLSAEIENRNINFGNEQKID